MENRDRLKMLDETIKKIDEIEANKEKEREQKRQPFIDNGVSASYMNGMYYTTTAPTQQNAHTHSINNIATTAPNTITAYYE